MPSIKDLKKRIGSTKNTQQTTRAMKMVSAAKLRRAQEAILAQRPYARRIGELIRTLMAMPDLNVKSELLSRDATFDSEKKKKLLFVVVTSDRGLCAGFNSNIIKGTQRWMMANAADYESVTVSFVGRRGHDFFKTKGMKVGKYYAELGGKVTFEKGRALAKDLTDSYLSGEFDEIKVIYNEFKNAISQVVQVETFLPLEEAFQNDGSRDPMSEADAGLLIVKPDAVTVFMDLLQKHLPSQAFRILLESQASEHGARMSAMESATKNAGEMIRKLTLQYNKQRQASITKELLEIISGSESQKG